MCARGGNLLKPTSTRRHYTRNNFFFFFFVCTCVTRGVHLAGVMFSPENYFTDTTAFP